MATITITIPNAQLARTVDGLCGYGNYQATLEDGTPNPVTRAEFARLTLIGLAKDAVRSHETNVARAAAAAAAAPDMS